MCIYLHMHHSRSNLSQSLSAAINLYQPLSKSISLYHSQPICINSISLHQSLSISSNLWQSLFMLLDLCQSLPASTNLHQPTTLYQSRSLSITLCQPLLISTHQQQAVSFATNINIFLSIIPSPRAFLVPRSFSKSVAVGRPQGSGVRCARGTKKNTRSEHLPVKRSASSCGTLPKLALGVGGSGRRPVESADPKGPACGSPEGKVGFCIQDSLF